MNIHNMKENISSLLARSVDRFNCIRKQLKHIKNIADKNNVSGCIDLVDDFVEISIKSEKEEFERLIKSCEETDNLENDLVYKYFLITIRDNDFYNSLNTLGDIFVKTFGYEFESNRFDFDKFKIHLPDLICSIFSICQNEHSDYVHKYLKICYTPEEINDFIKKYGMDDHENYENPLFKDDPLFNDVVHCDCNAESLVIKLVYNKDNNVYIEEKSGWIII